MNSLIFRKRIRSLAARLGVLRPLRKLVFTVRGVKSTTHELEFLSRFIDRDSHVFDVGANRGQSSENYIKLGARVVAFEPQEDLHPEILQLCGNSPRLTIVPFGIGSKIETRQFFITEYDQVASFREDWEGERIGQKTIQVSTLDHQISIHGRPSYCKIDVEGWELEVLKGLSQAIPIISFEFHLSASEIDSAKKVLARVSQLGRYFCNIKLPDDIGFHLNEFITLERFVMMFPDKLARPITTGYGDIYCSLDPSIIREDKSQILAD